MYKEYDFIEVKKDDYIGKIYKDNMFGMEFTNFSLYKGGEEIFHSTLPDKDYTEEDVLFYIGLGIDILEMCKNKEKKDEQIDN